MHLAWMKHIGGRLESRYQYGIGVVYKTFPWLEASDAQKDRIRELAQAVLDARAVHPDATLADPRGPDFPILSQGAFRSTHPSWNAALWTGRLSAGVGPWVADSLAAWSYGSSHRHPKGWGRAQAPLANDFWPANGHQGACDTRHE